jgi:hypothetical protein
MLIKRRIGAKFLQKIDRRERNQRNISRFGREELGGRDFHVIFDQDFVGKKEEGRADPREKELPNACARTSRVYVLIVVACKPKGLTERGPSLDPSPPVHNYRSDRRTNS